MPDLVRLEVDDGVGRSASTALANAISPSSSSCSPPSKRRRARRRRRDRRVRRSCSSRPVRTSRRWSTTVPTRSASRCRSSGMRVIWWSRSPKIRSPRWQASRSEAAELSLACDLRYAADDATVGQPEVAIGVMPGAGGTQHRVARGDRCRARPHLHGEAGPGRGGARPPTGRAGPPRGSGVRSCRAGRPPVRARPPPRAGRRRGGPPGRRGTVGSRRRDREKELFISLFEGPDQREGMRAFLEKRTPSLGEDPLQASCGE